MRNRKRAHRPGVCARVQIRIRSNGGIARAAVIVGLAMSGGTLNAADLPAGPPPAESAQAASNESVRVAASGRYRAGRVHRFVLGGGYRDLWETEIELPVLDLGTEGGGLTPTGRFGGLQTAVLGFQGADGRAYSFRGTDKDPSAVLDEMLRDTIVQTLVQDQMAAQHPGGPLAAGVLTEAAGVLTVHEHMVVMPDDPRLGEFREEFAGMVGTFFEYPRAASATRPGFTDAIEILDHEELYARLEQGNEVDVDAEAFLRARLMDMLIGDFDRHRKQWRWAELPGEKKLQPIPEDRDQAFVRYDGVAQRVMKVYIPILQNYDADYPFVKGLTLHGWEQDRWLLAQLSWSQWQPVIAGIQTSLTDEVIEEALAKLPPEYVALDGERFRHDVGGRRDQLPEVARRFYLFLAEQVDIQTSDAGDDVEVVIDAEGNVRVEVRARETTGEIGRLLFVRDFHPNETQDLRVYLRDGNDRVRLRGGDTPIRLRLLAGTGAKQVEDASLAGVRIYDVLGTVEVAAGPATQTVSDTYVPPPPDSGFVDVEDVPPRDWGSDTIPIPEFGYQPDVGVYLGAAVAHTRYGFRKHPWSSKQSVGFGWAFGANAPRVRYRALFRTENSDLVGGFQLGYSGIEVLRFYGFGNDTSDERTDKFFRVRNQVYRATGMVSKPVFADRAHLSGGPLVQFSRTANGARLVDQLAPYGNHDFGLVGAVVNFRFDTRKSVPTKNVGLEVPFHENPAAGYPTSGVLFDVTGRFQPPIWDVDVSYGSVEASIAGFVSIGESDWATLAVRIGGKETFGPAPYFDYAYIGGGQFFSGSATDRGFRTRRFAGDSSAFGNTDLRIVLGRLKIIVPGDVGIHGFFDLGRVFINDETSDNWHPSGGAGVWFSPLIRTNTISASVAHSSEDTLAYVRVGFHY